MTDIILSTAWRCGEKGCAVQWHKADYWLDTETDSESGYTVDWYGDGDHESVEEAELPPAEEVEAGWREYAEHVAETGEDPLGNYVVPRTRKVVQHWGFRFNNSIIGPVLVQARRGKHDWLGRDLPAHVRRYLNLDEKHCRRLQDFASWEELVAAQPGVRRRRWWWVKIEHEQPRRAEVVAWELKRAARKHLKSMGGGATGRARCAGGSLSAASAWSAGYVARWAIRDATASMGCRYRRFRLRLWRRPRRGGAMRRRLIWRRMRCLACNFGRTCDGTDAGGRETEACFPAGRHVSA